MVRCSLSHLCVNQLHTTGTTVIVNSIFPCFKRSDACLVGEGKPGGNNKTLKKKRKVYCKLSTQLNKQPTWGFTLTAVRPDTPFPRGGNTAPKRPHLLHWGVREGKGTHTNRSNV